MSQQTKFCHEVDETPQHVLGQSFFFMGTQHPVLGKHKSQPEEIKTIITRKILQFFNTFGLVVFSVFSGDYNRSVTDCSDEWLHKS